MPKSKLVTVNGFTWEADYLIEQIEMAMQLTWQETFESATEGYNHCLICGYAFGDNERTKKYRCQEGDKGFWLEPYCYEHFIEKNGIDKIIKEISKEY